MLRIEGVAQAVADEVDRHPAAAALPMGEGAAGRHRDHRPQVADHADLADSLRRLEIAVVERPLDSVREAVATAQQLAAEPVEQVLGLGPAAVAARSM